MGAEDFCVSPEHGSGDDLWVGWDSVFVNDLWNWFPVMIYGSVGTQFSSMISDCDVVYGR